MKRVICLITVMVLALGCGLPVTGAAEAEPVEIRNDTENFTILVPEGVSYKVDDSGWMLILPDAGSVVPRVFLDRRIEKYDPVDYLHVFLPAQAEERYGDRLQGQVLLESFEIGGRKMPAARFIYKDENGTTVNELNLWETRDDGDVEYQAVYLNSQQDTAMKLLDTVVRYYRPYAAYTGKGSGSPAPGGNTGNAAAPGTVLYRDPGDRFALLIPAGWKLVTDRDDDGFCFRVYDPDRPGRSFFMFLTLAPFLKDQKNKDFYVRNREFGFLYDYYARAPVMEKPDLASFLAAYPEGRAAGGYFYQMNLGLGLNPAVYPQINNAGIRRTEGLFTSISAQDDAGNPLDGLVTAKSMNGFRDEYTQVDTWVVMGFSGIIVPQGEMENLLPVMAKCLCSFAFNPTYVKNRIDLSEEWKNAMLAQGEYMQAMHDAMVEAWLGN